VEIINGPIRLALDGALRIFAPLPPVLTLALLTIVPAIVILLLMRLPPSPARLVAAKRQVAGGLYELRLFRHDPSALWKAQRSLIAAQLRYLRYSLLPLVIAIPLVTLVIGHLEPYFGTGAPPPDHRTIVAAVLSASDNSRPAWSLRGPSAVTIGEAVWLPATRTLMWEVGATATGRYELTLDAGTGAPPVPIVFVAGPGLLARVAVRSQAAFYDRLLAPAAPPLPAAAGIERIEVDYPRARLDVLGFGVPWELAFFVLLFAAILVLRAPMGVEL
jgi:hypothetical protein